MIKSQKLVRKNHKAVSLCDKKSEASVKKSRKCKLMC